VDSVQYTIRESFIVKDFFITEIKVQRSNAPLNSSLRMVTDFSGATFDGALSSRVWMSPLELMVRGYTQAPYASSWESQKISKFLEFETQPIVIFDFCPVRIALEECPGC
jgi:hypothetical protein